LIQVTSTIPQYKDKLIPLHHGDEGDDVNEGEGAIGSGSGSVPLLSLQSSDPYCVLSISPPSHHEIDRRAYIYYSVLGRDNSVEDKFVAIRPRRP
jgi:hypothetical protein